MGNASVVKAFGDVVEGQLHPTVEMCFLKAAEKAVEEVAASAVRNMGFPVECLAI